MLLCALCVSALVAIATAARWNLARLLTSLMALDSMISLKYWLDEPFWTMMSGLDLLAEGPECTAASFSWPAALWASAAWSGGCGA